MPKSLVDICVQDEVEDKSLEWHCFMPELDVGREKPNKDIVQALVFPHPHGVFARKIRNLFIVCASDNQSKGGTGDQWGVPSLTTNNLGRWQCCRWRCVAGREHSVKQIVGHVPLRR